jgi:hypothetical protein
VTRPLSPSAAHEIAPASLPTREEAFARASAIFTRAVWEAAWLFAEQGAMAVAEAAYEPGGPSVEEIAAKYEALHARAVQERAEKDAAKAGAA